jgi:lysophospholipase L1-like esterase
MPCKQALSPDASDPYGPLARELGAAGVPVLASAAALRADGAALAPLFFRDDPHLNAAGNRALALAVAAFLEEHVGAD